MKIRRLEVLVGGAKLGAVVAAAAFVSGCLPPDIQLPARSAASGETLTMYIHSSAPAPWVWIDWELQLETAGGWVTVNHHCRRPKAYAALNIAPKAAAVAPVPADPGQGSRENTCAKNPGACPTVDTTAATRPLCPEMSPLTWHSVHFGETTRRLAPLPEDLPDGKYRIVIAFRRADVGGSLQGIQLKKPERVASRPFDVRH